MDPLKHELDVEEALLQDQFQQCCQLHLDGDHLKEMAVKGIDFRRFWLHLGGKKHATKGKSRDDKDKAVRDIIRRHPGFDPVFMKV